MGEIKLTIDGRTVAAQKGMTVLEVAHQPAQRVLWLGGALVVLGVLGLLVPRAKVWARVSAENDHTVIKVREQTKGLLQLRGTERRSTTARLRDALGSSSPEKAAAQQQAHDLLPEQNHTTHRNNQ